ncbi:exonuclease domain-containing protein [Streptomyces sp. NPDC127033]|uniref:3'-5' exonuclease n=1 Tax=Streptomyces sp. NPDC127033 TaxID=3347110 RepID=UPI00365A47CE
MNFSSWPPLLVVDVKSNGANPPDLVEVAALPVREGQPDTSTAGAWLTKPRHPVTPFAARVHGLTNERLENEPGWEEIADQVHTLMGTSWICAHNAHVDHRVLSAHLPTWRPAGCRRRGGRACPCAQAEQPGGRSCSRSCGAPARCAIDARRYCWPPSAGTASRDGRTGAGRPGHRPGFEPPGHESAWPLGGGRPSRLLNPDDEAFVIAQGVGTSAGRCA